MLNNLFGLAGCASGVHQGEWQHAPDGGCLLVQVCPLCGAASQRIEHTWGNWEYVPLFEAQARACLRCNDLSFDLPGEADLPTLSQIDQAVGACIQTADLDALQSALEENQAVLFTPVLEMYFRYCRTEYSGNAEALGALEQIQAVLQACQENGITETVGSLRQGASQTSDMQVPVSQDVGPMDISLVGRWRNTEAMSSGGFSMATDTYLVLDAAGRFSWSSHSVNAFGESKEGPEYGRWSAQDGVLELRFDSGERMSRQYTVSQNFLLLPQEGRYRHWEAY
jgi:hypothetical protein